MGGGATTSLTPADAAAILEEIPNVVAVSPGLNSRQQIIASAGNWQTQVQGTGAALPQVRAWPVDLGSFFDETSVARADKVVVLGAGTRDQLFGENADPVGQVVRIANQPFRVIGVMGRKGQSAMGQDQDDAVFMPYTTVQKRIQGVQHVSNISVLVAEGAKSRPPLPPPSAISCGGGTSCSRRIRTTSPSARPRRWRRC